MTKLQEKRDYRHHICAAITLVSLLFGFLFPNSIPRIIEALRDLFVSFAFYVFELIDPETNPIPATINRMPVWQFAPEIWKPVTFLPASVEEFFTFWGEFLKLLFDKYNFLFYWYAVGDFLFYAGRFLLLGFPLVILVIMMVTTSKDKTCTERGKKSKALQKFEGFLFNWIFPVINWVKSFIGFLKENPMYYRSWLTLWALHFNLFSIGISLAGYYFYLVSSWDLLSIYTQLLKLQKDLTPVLRFMPGITWLVLGWKIYVHICEDAAFNALYAGERANRAVLEQASIITSVYGEPGLGKTLLITSMALSSQVKQFDDAFKIMLTRSAQFPNFPWQIFRDYIDGLIEERKICDINQAKAFIASRRQYYDWITNPVNQQRMARKHPQALKSRDNYTFGYDYVHYSSTYNDELKIIHLFDALESYAQAYLIFTVETTLLFSNYSIRTDSLITTIGNLPLRDNDFFHRDPALQEMYSQHSHIIDYDIIRLGKKFIDSNEKANGAPIGVYVVSEIDKEFKNMNLLKETKSNVNEVNQKNDLHDAALMMIRHGAVIDNKAFITVLADLQRPEAWGAGGRELGNVVFIPEKMAMTPVLPFFSSYWLTQWVFSWLEEKWNVFHTDYCYRRSDDTLIIYSVRNIMSKIHNHYEKLQNLFGMQKVVIQIQSGRLDGELRQDWWRIMSKKDFAERYGTDCLNSVWHKATPNTMHIDDFICYAAKFATKEECQLQNSYFQRDIHKMKAIYT